MILHKSNCPCIVCKNKRKEPHKPDCGCAPCKSKRGEFVGKNHHFYGKKLTKEHREKIGISKKNKFNHKPNCPCCICIAKRGEQIISKEIKLKMSLASLGKPKSKEHAKNISKSHIGIKLSENHIKNMSLALKGRSSPMKDKHHTKETKTKISNSEKGKIIPISVRKQMSLTRGGTGIPYELTEYGSEFDNSLKEQVRFRDKYTCQLCGCSQLENGSQLDCHHIDYNKKNNDINNLISLCDTCHCKTNTNRKYWTNRFLEFGVQKNATQNTIRKGYILP